MAASSRERASSARPGGLGPGVPRAGVHVAGGPVLCAFALACPWATTGAVSRSGYGFIRAVRASDFTLPAGAAGWSWLVFCVPVLACTGVALAWAGGRRSVGAVASVSGLVTLVYSVCMFVAFGARGPLGPWAGAAAGLLSFALAIPPLTAPTKARRRSHVRRQPVAATTNTP
jgi:hypothetical protein